jgi:Concanavalin A-like lectin/glucanases superfamily
MSRLHISSALALVAAFTASICLPAQATEPAFPAAVEATHPIAYYRLDATTGKSLAGTSTYTSKGGVSIATTGAPVATANSRSLVLNGKDGYILTNQMGGVGTAATIMAWVNLADLPSNIGHIDYVAGESENGNNLDLQFENDNVLRFFIAAGGHLSFTPPPATLLHQWHMIVATLDTPTHTRAIYWDGKQVATDKGGGEAGKKNAFSIGESTVFTGRFFKGSIDQVALWNRALKASEVAAIYDAAKPK